MRRIPINNQMFRTGLEKHIWFCTKERRTLHVVAVSESVPSSPSCKMFMLQNDAHHCLTVAQNLNESDLSFMNIMTDCTSQCQRKVDVVFVLSLFQSHCTIMSG